MPGTVDAKVKWGKEEITLSFAPEQGVKALKTELEEKTGVPVDRMKIMPKSKGRENQNSAPSSRLAHFSHICSFLS